MGRTHLGEIPHRIVGATFEDRRPTVYPILRIRISGLRADSRIELFLIVRIHGGRDIRELEYDAASCGYSFSSTRLTNQLEGEAHIRVPGM